MSKGQPANRTYSLSVEFRNSAIAGRGVFAKQRFAPGQRIVAYAPKQAKVVPTDPRAIAAADTKLTLLSESGYVMIPDTAVPGGWLCNHSCAPNAAIFSEGDGRIQCVRPIARGDEVTVFYGWVTQNQPERDPCRCGSEACRRSINFDVTEDDARHIDVVDGRLVVLDDALHEKLAEYGAFLESIGQGQVQGVIATTLARMKEAL